VTRLAGNLMIDSPRWTREVYEPLDEHGGLAMILLSHRTTQRRRPVADRFGVKSDPCR
jgi:hypothetical protein